MRKTAHQRLVLSCAGLAGVFLLLASCDDVERHRTLSFFFDGVPPLPAVAAEAGITDPNAGEATAGSRTGGWYVHEPLNDCTNCHVGGSQRTFSRRVRLVAEVPELCHRCHQEYRALEGWIHGPVATGQCLFCHEPHKARNASLLVKPPPDLCYQCHEPEAVRLVENHAQESYAHCVDCHEGHAGATTSLLKPAFLKRPAGLMYLKEAHQRQYEESLKKARNDLAQGRDPLSMLQAVIDDVETGRPWSARARLEAVADSGAVADQEKAALAEVLRQLTAPAEGQPAIGPDGANTEASLSAVQEDLAAQLRAMRDRSSERNRATAERYYDSIKLYHAGELAKAKAGFLEVLRDTSVPAPMKETARDYLERIEAALKGPQEPGWQVLR